MEPLLKDNYQISIYYSQSSGKINFSFEDKFFNKWLLIYNINGKLIVKFDRIKKSAIWRDRPKSGVYFLTVLIGNNNIIRKFVIK